MNNTKPLRLWPGVAAATILVLVGFVLPIFAPRYGGLGFIAAAVLGLVILLWWVAFSRARWYERVGAIVLLVAAAFVEKYIVHPSIAGGAMGNMAYILVIPTLSVALVAWAVVSRRLAPGARIAAAAAAIALGCLPWMVLRTGGISADGRSDLHWRWSMTPEQQLLAQAGADPRTAVPARSAPPTPAVTPAPVRSAAEGAATATPPDNKSVATATPPDKAAKPAAAPEPIASPAPATRAEWPGFRGPERDGVVRGVQIATDWSQSPPVRAVAAPDRPRLVVVRGPRRRLLHAGAARRRRDRRLLPAEHRRAGLAASRPDAVLGVERRRRSARHADAAQRPRLHVRRDRHR